MKKPRRVLTIGHSYCVRRNRELAEAICAAGGDQWQVTVVAPETFPGDLGPVITQRTLSERAELRTVPVHRARHIHVMSYGQGLRSLLDDVWDVVHCWEEPYVLSAAQIARACRPASALVYATFQNLAKTYPVPFGAIERFSMHRARGWVAFGTSIAETLVERPVYAGRPRATIPFGVDVDRFAPDTATGAALRTQLRWLDGVPVVGFLGRFVEAKGLPLLLDTLQDLERRGVAWRALFVGGGPLEAQLQAFAAERAGRVCVATGVSHDDVPRYLCAMDVLCAPSQSTPRWREQFGRMIVEGFACGVPVVGSDSGEIPHVIGDGGIVVGEQDRQAWSDALAGLLTDAGARRALGGRGRERAEREFAWPVVGLRHLAFFEKLLEN